MKKYQSLALNSLALLLVLMATLLAVQNWGIRLPEVQLGQWHFTSTSLGSWFLAQAGLTGLAFLCKMLERQLMLGSQYQKASRDLERKEVSREEAESKVKALEQKVQTLEKALSEALKIRK